MLKLLRPIFGTIPVYVPSDNFSTDLAKKHIMGARIRMYEPNQVYEASVIFSGNTSVVFSGNTSVIFSGNTSGGTTEGHRRRPAATEPASSPPE